MHPPFTTEQFFDVFRRYNEAVWPAQIALIAAGFFAAFAAYRANVQRSARWARASLIVVALLWLWTGIVYLKHFFATLTMAGQTFGSFFIAEAVLLSIAAWESDAEFVPASRYSIGTGALLLMYAFFAYPALGMIHGHRYPNVPTFGVPCPTTIFTFGIFCLLPSSIPRFAMAIPVLWAAIGAYAAFGFGVHEDLGLAAAAIAAIAIVHHESDRARVSGFAV
jgi:hypothetical protein